MPCLVAPIPTARDKNSNLFSSVGRAGTGNNQLPNAAPVSAGLVLNSLAYQVLPEQSYRSSRRGSRSGPAVESKEWGTHRDLGTSGSYGSTGSTGSTSYSSSASHSSSSASSSLSLHSPPSP